MFSIAFRYLCGFASASRSPDSSQPEWPPNPDRVFMALVAAYEECERTDVNRATLEWLESLPAPSITCGALEAVRVDASVFVPINDFSDPWEKKGKKIVRHQTIQSANIGRSRKPRAFPTAFPDSDEVHLIYTSGLHSEHRTALQSLCAKVGYVGDTASLVQMWVEDTPPKPMLVSVGNTRSAMRLRIPYAGRLADLEKYYQRDMVAGEYRPRSFRWGHYAPPSTDAPDLPGSDYRLLVFRRAKGDVLDIRDTLALSDALRGAVMSATPKQPPPEWVSGHTPEGQHSERPHLAFLALPFVGHVHADGSLKGAALGVPNWVPQDDLNALLDGLFGADEPHPAPLRMGRAGAWQIEPDDSVRPLVALDLQTWCGPSRRWATVTPIALDRFPKADGDAEAAVARACGHIGLPQPRDVVIVPAPLFSGALPVKTMPLLPTRDGKGTRAHVHALLIFDRPVNGPVFLGAGRFRGYGLCRPYAGGGAG